MERFYLYVAVPASIILFIQTIMTFVGVSGDVDLDFDADGEIDLDGGNNMTIFSVRNLVAFFTFFGWSGLWMLKNDMNPVITGTLSVLVGILFVVISMGLFFAVAKMQRSGNLNLSNAIGKTGEVYIPIPAQRKRSGKILINVQGSLKELEALTDDENPITTGTQVEVIGILQPSKLLVTQSNKGEIK